MRLAQGNTSETAHNADGAPVAISVQCHPDRRTDLAEDHLRIEGHRDEAHRHLVVELNGDGLRRDDPQSYQCRSDVLAPGRSIATCDRTKPILS